MYIDAYTGNLHTKEEAISLIDQAHFEPVQVQEFAQRSLNCLKSNLEHLKKLLTQIGATPNSPMSQELF
jgi:hypothetical protein